MPINATASILMRFGNQLVSLGGGVRYWLDSPDSGAEGLDGAPVTMVAESGSVSCKLSEDDS